MPSEGLWDDFQNLYGHNQGIYRAFWVTPIDATGSNYKQVPESRALVTSVNMQIERNLRV